MFFMSDRWQNHACSWGSVGSILIAGPLCYAIFCWSLFILLSWSYLYAEVLDSGCKFHQLARPSCRDTVRDREGHRFDLAARIVENTLLKFKRRVQDIGIAGSSVAAIGTPLRLGAIDTVQFAHHRFLICRRHGGH